MEMRLLLSMLVHSFSFRFPEKERDTHDNMVEIPGFLDYFPSKVTAFELIFSKRERERERDIAV
jgi:hypothetical protein